jgi:hypothetical protein
MTSSPAYVRFTWRVTVKFGIYTDARFLPRWSWLVTFTGPGVIRNRQGVATGAPGGRVMAVVDGRSGTIYAAWYLSG